MDERHIEYAFFWTNLEGKDILDVGCGTSELMLGLFKLGYNAWGIDSDCANPCPNFKREGAEKMSFGDGCFDTVSCISVLEHMSTEVRNSSLREMDRVLKKGGIMLITCPFGGSWGNACIQKESITGILDHEVEDFKVFDQNPQGTEWDEKKDLGSLNHAVMLLKLRKR